LPGRYKLSGAGTRALARVRSAWWPCALAAFAAALAWLIAHRLLGHQQPFFAPIAAAIALSTSQIQRSRRTAQMVAGVLLGIGIGVGLQAVLGTSTTALGVIVLVTMIVALAAGAGFFGEGMMFPNQAAASAVLVVTLHRHGTGAERAVDALIGGAVALVLGVGLFPAEPMSMLHDAERSVIRMLAGTLESVAEMLARDELPEEGWTLTRGYELHQGLAGLARARATARLNVRVAPRRWRLRAAVDAEVARTAQLDLLANAVLSLVRSATLMPAAREPLPSELQEQIAILAAGLRRLADAGQPWRRELVSDVTATARDASAHTAGLPVQRGAVVASILRATAADLIALIDAPDATETPHVYDGRL
jgi:uncharacterized membrane protein YgaE (UPF0421/DUF939 family)